MKGLSYYFINMMNQSDYQAQQEYAHADEQTRKLIDESAGELGQMIKDENNEKQSV